MLRQAQNTCLYRVFGHKFPYGRCHCVYNSAYRLLHILLPDTVWAGKAAEAALLYSLRLLHNRRLRCRTLNRIHIRRFCKGLFLS